MSPVHHSLVQRVKLGTSSKTDHVPFATVNTLIVRHVIQPSVQLAKVDTFWKITHVTFVIQDSQTVLLAILSIVMLVRLVTSLMMAFVPSAKTNIQTVRPATLSIVFHAKTVTFWRTTLVISVTLFDSQTATHAIQQNASHATQELSLKTKTATFVQPGSLNA